MQARGFLPQQIYRWEQIEFAHEQTGDFKQP
jgi:hypothetical protein